MKVKLNLYFRRFNGPKEDEDSGYYSAIDNRKTCRIDVNLDDPPFEQALTIYQYLDDPPFEQALTIYHEITHFLFDLYSQYELDNARQQVIKRDRKLKDEWRVYNDQVRKKRKDRQYKEEIICGKVEAAVRKVLKRQIPKSFQKQFFTNKKKVRIMSTKKRRRK